MEIQPTFLSTPELSSEPVTAQVGGVATETSASGWGVIPLLVLASTIGILLESVADVGGRATAWWAEPLFWGGLLVIFLPLTWCAIRPHTHRTARVIMVVTLGVELYIVKVLQYPLGFSQYDEFQHWRSALDIAQTGHLFHANLLLPISPLYPGLEIVTNALSNIAGISIFMSATLLIGIARLLLMLGLFLLAEGISHSHQLAAIATVAFLANPLFLFFDAQFAYESLALPLAVSVLVVLITYSQARGASRWPWLTIMWALIAATTVTHHLTSYALLALLALWWVIRWVARGSVTDQVRPGPALISGIELGLAWLLIAGGLVVRYLATPILNGVKNVVGIILHEDSTRLLFHDAAGAANPLWQQVLSVSSVGLLTMCVVTGSLLIWRRHRTSSAMLMIGAVALAYPLSQTLRLTKNGASYATRPMDFFFLAVAYVVALVAMWLISPSERVRWLEAVPVLPLTMLGLLIIVAGGVAIGSGPSWTHLPGPHIVEGNQRSIGPEDIAAARWSLSYLGSGRRVATDQDDALLMGTYGLQDIVTPAQGVDLANVYFSPTIGPFQRELLRRAQVRYVVIDLRLATALPANGIYYVSGESGAHPLTHPISIAALTKYGSTPGVDTLYDSGNMRIYDIGAITQTGANP